MSVKWLFFDIGDVLFDENAQHQYLFHSLLLAMRRQGMDVTWDAYHAQLKECVRQTPGRAHLEAVAAFVPDEAQGKSIIDAGNAEYHEMRKPRPYGMLTDNILSVVQELRRDFQLGIIANQHPPIMDALRDYGLRPYFDVIAIDEILGVSKPDPAIFRWALEQANCAPEEAIMIGDRADVDVAPAKTMGLGTVRFKRGQLYVYYDPRSDAERADVVVYQAGEIVPAVRRIAAARQA